MLSAHSHSGPPPWKSLLEQTISLNPQKQYRVQLAALDSNQRPSCQNMQFRGFVSQSSYEFPSSLGDSPEPRNNSLSSTKLESLLLFFVDIRSARDDFGVSPGNDSFAEVCWYFETSMEQYRLAGRLHLIAEPDSVIAQTSIPFWAKSFDFEKLRRSSWDRLSLAEKKGFASASPPGTLITTEKSRSEETIRTLEYIEKVKSRNSTLMMDRVMSEKNDLEAAFSNFGLLLLDVDRVDYLDTSIAPSQRFVYNMRIPERTYGRISGIEWDVSRRVC